MRRKRAVATVNVNEVRSSNLDRMATEDLYSFCETALMIAGYHLGQWHSVHRAVDETHLDQAVMQAEFALEGLRALRDRR